MCQLAADEQAQAIEWVATTKAYKELKRRIEGNIAPNGNVNKKSYLESINSAVVHLHTELGKIKHHFSTYTSHNLQHCNKVIDYMYTLIPKISLISDEELMLIIFSGLFHDIGMAYDDDDVKDDDIGIIESETYRILLSKYNQDEKTAKRETLRTLHGELAEKKIDKYLSDPNKKQWFTLTSEDGAFNGYDISDFVKKICRSHQEEVAWIQSPYNNLPPSIVISAGKIMSPQYVAYLLRIADLLDIDCKRAPKYYEWVYKLDATGTEHFLTNQVVCTSKKLLYCNDKPCTDCSVAQSGSDCPKKLPTVCFEGAYPAHIADGDLLRCKVHEYIAYLETEIAKVNRASRDFKNTTGQEHYTIKICEEVRNRIATTDGHPEVSSQALSVNYDIIRELFLGKQLYHEHSAGLRELIQNAYDACKAKAGLQNLPATWEPRITIIWDETKNLLKISDNGIGMSYLDITEYFISVGKSKYNIDRQYLYSNFHYDHIGHFGIGFFAAFMLSESVRIFTRYIYGNKTYNIGLIKKNSIASIKSESANGFEGTTIELKLSDVCQNSFDVPIKLQQYIEKFFLLDGIRVQMKVNENALTELDLKSLSARYDNTYDLCLDLSDVLNDVQCVVYLRKRTNSIYENTNLVFDGTDFRVSDVTEFPALFGSGNNNVKYLNFPENDGVFNLFLNEANVSQDISQYMNTPGPRVRYAFSELPVIPNKSTKTIRQLCDDISVATSPRYADIMDLHLYVDGNNYAFVRENCMVSDIAEMQNANDACGQCSFTGNIYIRNVLIPNFECCIPFLDEEFEPIAIYANIKTKGVFPVLDRQSVSSQISDDFQYAVGKAITNKLSAIQAIAHRQKIILNQHYTARNDFIE